MEAQPQSNEQEERTDFPKAIKPQEELESSSEKLANRFWMLVPGLSILGTLRLVLPKFLP